MNGSRFQELILENMQLTRDQIDGLGSSMDEVFARLERLEATAGHEVGAHRENIVANSGVCRRTIKRLLHYFKTNIPKSFLKQERS